MLSFQTILRESGIDPADVRLLRHAKGGGTPGMHPYVAWRDHREIFDEYETTMAAKKRRFFDAPYWASFVAMGSREALFVGMNRPMLVETEVSAFHEIMTGRLIDAGRADRYALTKIQGFEHFAGKLMIDWGAGALAWAQYAHKSEKPVVELRRNLDERPYPGHSQFYCQLSEVGILPPEWRAILSSAKGVYLLTCPRTKEQYVGKAGGGEGFISRWETHAAKHGDAKAFRVRNPEDYRVSILEVAGSLVSDDEILQMEARWKEKLQSREMGLNGN